MRALSLALLCLIIGCDDGTDAPPMENVGGMGGAEMMDGSGGEGAGGETAPLEEHITAQIDGEPFAAQLVAGGMSDGELRFQSDQSQEEQMFFVLPDTVEPGTYVLSAEGEGPYTAKFGELFEGIFPTESGAIVIDGIDRDTQWVWGSFEFVGAQDNFGEITRVNITDGSFAVEYMVF